MRKADNLPPSSAFVTKSGNLNFLEPSGPIMGLRSFAEDKQPFAIVLNSFHVLYFSTLLNIIVFLCTCPHNTAILNRFHRFLLS